MKIFIASILTILLVSCNEKVVVVNQPEHTHEQSQNKGEPSNIELVFCLDATGSMSGLIHTAKEKIWDIVTTMGQSDPAPNIKLGMVFYRDRGDDFVTMPFVLTEDIDSIYNELLEIEANGGGDAPESVNLALHEAITQIGWSNKENVYQTVFLVGDCPPHMDYPQEVQYEETCKIANQSGININTIKLGSSCTEAIPHFKKIAELTNGEFKQLDQQANDVVINTPFDDSIRVYSNKIDRSKIYYGSKSEKLEMNLKKEKSLELYDKSSSNAISSRAKFNVSKAGKKNLYGNQELIKDIESKKVKLDEIKEEELPDEMKGLSDSEKKEYVEKVQKERSKDLKKLKELSKKREEFIKEKTEKDTTKKLFSKEIYKVVKEQAEKKGVKIKEK